MKKNKSKNFDLSIEDSLVFLEDMQRMQHDIDEPTEAISIRIPKNILRTLKTKAKMENRKYQSLIVEFIRAGLR